MGGLVREEPRGLKSDRSENSKDYPGGAPTTYDISIKRTDERETERLLRCLRES